LLVDDNRDASAQVRAWLGGTASCHELDWVTGLDAAREAFGRSCYDVCLLSDQLGGRAGLDLLRDLSAHNFPPIILLGESEDFEVDVEAARLGAYDYLVKSHINALLLDRSIRYAIQRKSSERELAQAQNFAQATVDALPDNIAVLDVAGQIVAMNAAWRNSRPENGFLGLQAGTGANYLRVCDDSGTPEGTAAAAGIRAVIAGGSDNFSLEYARECPGDRRWFDLRVTRFAGLVPIHVVVAHTNVTARKLAESNLLTSEANLARAQEMAHLGSWRVGVDAKGGFGREALYWSAENYRILGYAPDEVAPCFENFIRRVHPDDRERVEAGVASVLRGSHSGMVEHRIVLPDESVRFVQERIELLRDDAGTVTGAAGTTLDITERKRDEELLREREEFQRTLLKNFPNGSVSVFDRELRYVQVSGCILDMVGLNDDAIVGALRADVLPGPETEYAVCQYRRVLEGEPVEFELTYGNRHINVNAAPLRDADGNVTNILSVAQDITARKRTEDRLRNSEANLARAQRMAHLGSYERQVIPSTDALSSPLTWSDETFRILGYEPGEVETTVLNFVGRIHPEDREMALSLSNREVRPNDPHDLDHRILLPDGTVRWVHQQLEYLFDAEGNPLTSLGTMQDITERKQAELSLAASKAILARSQEMAHLGSWVHEYSYRDGIRHKVVVWSDETYRIFGWHPGEVEASVENLLRAVHPEDRVLVQDAASLNLTDPSPYAFDYRVLRPDGTVRVVRQEAVPEIEAGGRMVRTIGTIQDVTERRRDEQLLREREEFQRALLENFPNGSVTVFDREMRIIMVAGDALNLTGQGPGELIGKRREEVLPGEQTDWAVAHYRKALAGERVEFELVINSLWFNVVAVPLKDESGEVANVLAVSQDITARKMAETRLRESESDLAASQARAHLGSLELDFTIPPGGPNRRRWSDEAYRLLGFQPGEVEPTAEILLERVHPEDRHQVEAVAARPFEPGEPYKLEPRLLLPDGTVRWVHMEYEWVCDTAGKIVKSVGTMQDITERKRDEQLLREREEFQRALLENFPNGSVFVFDRDLRYVLAAGRGLRHTGFDSQSLAGMKREEVLPGEQTDYAVSLYRRVLEGDTVEFELRYGETVVNTVAAPLRNSDGEITNVLAVTQDITARKRAEERLRVSESELAASQERAHLGSFELDLTLLNDPTRSPRRWSAEAARLLGYDPAEAEASFELLYDRIHPEDRHLVDAAVVRPVRPHDPYTLEPRILLPDGTVRWVFMRLEYIFDEHGKPVKSVGTMQDITARKEAETQRDRFFTLSQDLLLIAGFDGFFKRVNPAFFETLGFTEAELTSRPFLQFVHPDDIAGTQAAFEGFFRGEAVTGFENRYLCKDGSWRWIDWKAVPVVDERLAYAAGRDVTERKIAETALLRLRDGLEERVQQRTAQLAKANASLQLEIGERMAAEAETRTRARQQETVAELGRRALSDVGLGTLLNTATELMATTLETDLCTYLEVLPEVNQFQIRAGSGWSTALAGPLEDHRIPAGVSSQAGFALHLDAPLVVLDLPSETRFNPSHMLLKHGVKSGVTVIVRGYEGTFGVLAAHSFTTRAFTRDDIHFLEAMANVLGAAIERHRVESEIRELNGQLNETNQKLTAENAERRIALGALREASEILKEANEEAERARKAAEVANLAKSEFLSRMSHELRTPLNAILGFGQLMAMEDELNPDEEENVDQILKAGRHLLDLINEVLDISRIEAGHLSLSPEPVSVAPTVREVIDLVRPLATPRGVSLFNETSKGGAAWLVVADQQRLKQVLLNLLSNAVKYNQDGGRVRVTCEANFSAPFVCAGTVCGGTLRVVVRDTGAGLSQEDVGRLFVPFERLGAARTSIEGTGIGLSLCKRLVEAMNGRIGVESEAGKGSAFWFELPLVNGPGTAIPNSTGLGFAAESVLETSRRLENPTNRGRKTVLYIEDNLSNISLIKRVVSDIDSEIQLLAAIQGSQGLDLAAEHQPDLILLDVHLPDIMGDVVLSRLRSNPVTCHIPVVVLTADAMPRQKEKMMNAGAAHFLTKPLDIPHFFEILREVLEPVDLKVL